MTGAGGGGLTGPPIPGYTPPDTSPGPGRGYGAANGLDMIVPSGFENNDSFPVWAQTGERVIVMTKQQQAQGGVGGGSLDGGGGNFYSDQTVYNIYDRGSMAMAMAQENSIKRDRLKNSMGR